MNQSCSDLNYVLTTQTCSTASYVFHHSCIRGLGWGSRCQNLSLQTHDQLQTSCGESKCINVHPIWTDVSRYFFLSWLEIRSRLYSHKNAKFIIWQFNFHQMGCLNQAGKYKRLLAPVGLNLQMFWLKPTVWIIFCISFPITVFFLKLINSFS